MANRNVAVIVGSLRKEAFTRHRSLPGALKHVVIDSFASWLERHAR